MYSKIVTLNSQIDETHILLLNDVSVSEIRNKSF